MLTQCPNCQGKKKVPSMGGMSMDCGVCHATGKIETNDFICIKCKEKIANEVMEEEKKEVNETIDIANIDKRTKAYRDIMKRESRGD